MPTAEYNKSELQVACVSTSIPEYEELLDVSRPTLCHKSYIETMSHVHHHDHVKVRWDAYRTALQRTRENKAADATLWNEADEVIGTLGVTINDILAVNGVDNELQCTRQNITPQHGRLAGLSATDSCDYLPC